MVSQSYTNAANQINEIRETIETDAESALENLTNIAIKLGLKAITDDLEKVKKRLKSEVFHIIVAGRFKGGKSTLLNALLGPNTRPIPGFSANKGPLAVDTFPCTAVLTKINFPDLEGPDVRVWHFDDTYEIWDLSKYLNEAVIKADKEEHKDFFKDIREFELYYPAELCQSGVTAIDSPGTEEDAQRTEIARQAAKESDAAIIVYPSHSFGGEREIGFAEEIMDSGTHVFTIVNLWDDGKPIDLKRLKGFVWNRLITDTGGPKYEDNDLSSQNIYFINAYQGLEGKFNHDQKLMAESGMTEFEKVLGDFLINNKYKAHINNLVGQAISHTNSLEQTIDQRRTSLEQDQQDLAKKIEEIQPKLQSIRNRRDRLPIIIDKARRDSRQALQVNFDEMMVRLQKDLPTRLKKHHLQSLEGIGGVLNTFRKKKIVNEAMGIAQKEIESAITAWSNNPPDQPGVKCALKLTLARLRDDISKEVEKMEKGFIDIQFELTGWQPPSGETNNPTGWVERVIGVGLGVLLSDVGLVFGGASGWRGFAGTLGGYALGGISVATLTALGAVVAWPVALGGVVILGLIGGRVADMWGLEDRIWETVLNSVNPNFPGWTREMTPKIDAAIGKIFEQIQESVMQEVGSLIDAEEQKLLKISQDNLRSKEEKQKLVRDFDQAKQQINDHRHLLKGVLVKVAQVEL
nr:dynamin family protein [uncultured Desulfobacter sp.]